MARRARRFDLVLIACAIGALVLSLASLAQLRASEAPTLELLLPKAYLAPLERIRGLFGPTAESEIVLLTSEAPIAPERLDAFEGALRDVPGVARVWSSRTRPRLAFSNGTPPTFAIAKGPPPGATPGPLDRFLAPSPTQAALWLVLDEKTRSLSEARRFEADLHTTLDGVRHPGESYVCVGNAARRVASWEASAKDARRALPWLILAVVLVPLVFFRSLVAVFFPLLIAGLTSGTLFVVYRAVYGQLDSWTLALLPLVWSIATMDALHLYEGTSDGDAGDEAVARARADVSLPALVTAGTTALGLSTLAFPGAPPLLRTFGLWGAFGTMLAFGFTFVLGGPLLRVFRARPIPRASRQLVRTIVVFARRRPTPTLAGWAVACLVAAACTTKLHVEASYQHPYAPGHPFGEAMHGVESAVGAELAPLDIYLEARTPRQRHPNELILATLAVCDYLATLPETRVTLSASTLLSEWVATDPRAKSVVRDPRFLERVHENVGPLLHDPLVDEWLRVDRGVSRIEVLTTRMTYARKEQVLGWIAHFVETGTIGYRVTFGGTSYFGHLIERDGMQGIAWGALTDFVLLGVVLIAVLRRARLVLVAFAGNLAPVLLLLGFMGAAGIPWSFDLLGLPMIVLGLAIDDTIHLLWPLRRAPPRELGATLHRSVRAYGVAVTATAVLLAASLAGLSLSGFGVNHELGLLMPVGLLLGIAAELTLVPAAVQGFRRARAGGTSG